MKPVKIFLLSLLAVMMVGCSRDDEPKADNTPKVTDFKGTPGVFNGDWSGTGYVAAGRAKLDNLSYQVQISNTPTGLDFEITAYTSDGAQILYAGLNGHYVRENDIFDLRDDKRVGSIGSDGFSITRPNVGELIARRDASGAITITAFMLDEGQRYDLYAVIKK